MEIQERAPHRWISDDALFKDTSSVSGSAQIFGSFFENLRGQIENAKVPTDICVEGLTIVNFTRIQQNHISRREMMFRSSELDSLTPCRHQANHEGIVPMRHVGMVFEVSREQFDSREVWPAENLSLLTPGAACATLRTTRQLGLGMTFHRKKATSSMDRVVRKLLVKNCGLFVRMATAHRRRNEQ